MLEVLHRECGEAGPEHVQPRLNLHAQVDNVKTDGFPFAVAICPDDEVVRVFGVQLKVLNDGLGRVDRLRD